MKPNHVIAPAGADAPASSLKRDDLRDGMLLSHPSSKLKFKVSITLTVDEIPVVVFSCAHMRFNALFAGQWVMLHTYVPVFGPMLSKSLPLSEFQVVKN